MATKTYDEYLADQLAASKKQTDEFAARRKTQAQEAARVSDAVYDAAIETSQKDHEASAKQTEDSYRSVYDANAVNELVMRREIQEAIANMGLTDSGLNATQQTAVSLQRGRADSEATRQKQAAVDAIMRELDRERAQYTAKKTAASHDIFEQADADILSFGNSADEAASKTALSLYEVDREAEAAGSAAGQQEGSDGTVTINQRNSIGTPSYTAINAQAMIYSRTDKAKANDYIERQYNAGYITDEQKNALLAKYGKGGLHWAENELYTLDEYNDIRRPPYGNYEGYIKHMITEWANDGLITPDEARALAVAKGIYKG